MKRKISLIGINLLAIALMIGHLLYVAIAFPDFTARAVNIGIASVYGVVLFLLDVGFLLAWLITKKKQPKFKIIFLIVNVIILLAMIVSVVYSLHLYNPMTESAPQDICFLLALLFLLPLFVANVISRVVYWICKK